MAATTPVTAENATFLPDAVDNIATTIANFVQNTTNVIIPQIEDYNKTASSSSSSTTLINDPSSPFTTTTTTSLAAATLATTTTATTVADWSVTSAATSSIATAVTTASTQWATSATTATTFVLVTNAAATTESSSLGFGLGADAGDSCSSSCQADSLTFKLADLFERVWALYASSPLLVALTLGALAALLLIAWAFCVVLPILCGCCGQRRKRTCLSCCCCCYCCGDDDEDGQTVLLSSSSVTSATTKAMAAAAAADNHNGGWEYHSSKGPDCLHGLQGQQRKRGDSSIIQIQRGCEEKNSNSAARRPHLGPAPTPAPLEVNQNMNLAVIQPSLRPPGSCSYANWGTWTNRGRVDPTLLPSAPSGGGGAAGTSARTATGQRRRPYSTAVDTAQMVKGVEGKRKGSSMPPSSIVTERLNDEDWTTRGLITREDSQRKACRRVGGAGTTAGGRGRSNNSTCSRPSSIATIMDDCSSLPPPPPASEEDGEELAMEEEPEKEEEEEEQTSNFEAAEAVLAAGQTATLQMTSFKRTVPAPAAHIEVEEK